jgi:hypothetical protein
MTSLVSSFWSAINSQNIEFTAYGLGRSVDANSVKGTNLIWLCWIQDHTNIKWYDHLYSDYSTKNFNKNL